MKLLPVASQRVRTAWVALLFVLAVPASPAPAAAELAAKRPLTFIAPTSRGIENRCTLFLAGHDLVLVDDASGRDLARQALAATSAVEIRGADGEVDDLLTVDLTPGMFTLPGGIFYDGGAGGFDTLRVKGGAVADERSTGAPNGGGTLELDGLVITYVNLEPVIDTVPASTLTVNGTAAAETITIDNGVANGDGRLRVQVTGFESIEFANKTHLVVGGGAAGGDTFVLDFSEAATSLVDITVSGGRAANTLNVKNTASGVTSILNGGIGDDVFNVSSDAPANTGVLTGVLGQLQLNGGGGNDTLNVSESGSISADTIVSDTGKAGEISSAVVGYDIIEIGPAFTGGVHIALGSGADTINVRSSYSGVTGSEPLFINAGGGNDTFDVSSNAPATTGNFAYLGSPVTLDGGAGVNQLVVSEAGETAADAFTITSTTIANTLPSFRPPLHLPLDLTFQATGGSFGAVSVLAGSGNTTFNVASAAAPLSVTGGAGDDVFNVTPSPTAPVTVAGGPQASADTLNILGSCTTIGASSVASAGNQPVAFSGIEVLKFNGTATVDHTGFAATVLGGTDTVNVTVPGGCQWTATPLASFLHVTSGASGTGPGATVYSVDSNSGGSARNGAVTIAASLVEVQQPADTTVPVADPQNVSTLLNTAKLITLTATDPDSPSLTFAIGTPPAHGALSGLNPATGAVTYTPTAGYNGPDSFTFTASDGLNVSSPATVSITVLAAVLSEIPTLGGRALLALMLALAAAGALALRRH